MAQTEIISEIERTIRECEAGATHKTLLVQMGVPWAMLYPVDFPPGSVDRYKRAMHSIIRLEASRENIVGPEASDLISRWDQSQGFLKPQH